MGLLSKLFVIVVCGFLVACNISRKAVPVSPAVIKDTDSIAGLKSIRASDCVTCHSMDQQLAGPSFLAIADKYEPSDKNVDKLSQKIMGVAMEHGVNYL